MRTMLKVTMPVEAGNRAVKDGSSARSSRRHREAEAGGHLFRGQCGMRSAMFFFDMKDASEIPVDRGAAVRRAEAKVELHPAMNGADLQKGLAAAMAAM